MGYIKTSPVKNSTIMMLYADQESINLDPPYQRMGGVWTVEKKQLLIDSILNDYDLPKIYFHQYDREKTAKTGIEYAVIDGRQRLEAIWGFIDGKFYLSDEFEYQKDTSLELRGLSYEDISQKYPKIKIQFDSFILPVIGVETDDEDLIEDMFSRLNEAVPLNAAEKRNAIGGDLVKAIRKVSEHRFFKDKVSFSNKRYQYREVSARFLLMEDSLIAGKRLLDTKKVYLDSLAKRYYSDNEGTVRKLSSNVTKVLGVLANIFDDYDPLLRAQGNMTVYYLVARSAIISKETKKLSRHKFKSFIDSLKANRELAEESYEDSSFALLEYDRLSQQGTNDASSIKERAGVLAEFLELSDQKM